MIEKTITLDILSSSYGETIHAVKGDTKSRRLIFSLCSGTTPQPIAGTSTVLLRCAVDGATILGTCEIINGNAAYMLSNAFCEKSGIFDCELAIYEGSGESMKILFCPKFRLLVEDNLESDAELIAEDRYEGLSTLINRAEAAAVQAENAMQSKADLVTSAVSGNFASLTSNGNITDSKKKPEDFAPKVHTHSLNQVTNLISTLNTYAAKVTGAVSGNFASLDANGAICDSGKSTNDFEAKTDAVKIYTLKYENTQAGGNTAENIAANKAVLAVTSLLDASKYALQLSFSGIISPLKYRRKYGSDDYYYFDCQISYEEDIMPYSLAVSYNKSSGAYSEQTLFFSSNDTLNENDFRPPTADLVKRYVDTKSSLKQDISTVQIIPLNMMLQNNKEFRFLHLGALNSFTVSKPQNIPDLFCGSFCFQSSSNGTTLTTAGITFVGDSCSGGVFVPAPLTKYEVIYKNCGMAAVPYVVGKVTII